MAGAEADAPGWLRRAAGLLAAFALAKLLVVLLRVADGGGAGLASPLTPAVLLYQDLWALAVFAVIDAAAARAVRERGERWRRAAALTMTLLYAGALGYSALNVAVARTMSTPLTALILGAAGGALSDSIKVYVTAANLGAMGAVIAAGVVVPWRLKRRPSRRVGVAAAALAALVLVVGPLGLRHVEALGLHRNALVILVRSSLAQLGGAGDDGGGAGAGAGGGSGRSGGAGVPVLPRAGQASDLSHLLGAARGRNVLWIGLESTGARYLGPYGGKPDPMPNVSKLARRALLFEHAYAAYPESIKGLWSVLCAASPAPHTVAKQYDARRLPCRALPAVLRSRGYRTALFHSGRFVYLGMQHIVRRRGFDTLRDAGGIASKHASSFGVDEASTVKTLLAWIDAQPRGQPFFAMYLPIAGHHPYDAPGGGPSPFGRADDRHRYLNDLYRADLAVGALVAGLRKRGLWQRTLVVVHGDHGQAFFQHEGNFAHTLFVYEENMRVPLLFVAPGLLTRARRAPQLASLTDLAPTLLALLGAGAAPAGWQGRSLLEALPRAVRFFADQSLLLLGLRHGRFKYIHEARAGRDRLFDLRADRMERHNLAARTEHAARVARYRAHVKAWAKRQRAWVLAGGRR